MTPGELAVAELKKQFGPSLEGRDAMLHCIVGHVNGAVQNERERLAALVRHADVYGGTDLDRLADSILGVMSSPRRDPIPSRPEIVAPIAGKRMHECRDSICPQCGGNCNYYDDTESYFCTTCQRTITGKKDSVVIAERRVCEKPGCGNLLDDAHKAVYCSNQCARDDA